MASKTYNTAVGGVGIGVVVTGALTGSAATSPAPPIMAQPTTPRQFAPGGVVLPQLSGLRVLKFFFCLRV